jgi:hypothetical protein
MSIAIIRRKNCYWRCVKTYLSSMFLTKLNVFLLFGLIISHHAVAIETLKFDKKLQWFDGEFTFSTTFDGAYLDPDNHDLPHVLFQLEKKAHYRIEGYRTTFVQYAPVSALENQLLEATKPASDWVVRASEVGQITMIQLRIPAFTYAKGRWQKLTEIQVEVDVVPGQNTSQRSLTYASQSVLAQGEWYKIAIAKDGIYKLDKALLSQMGVTNPNPQRINLYGNGGQLLPEDNSIARPDDLNACAMWFNGNADTLWGNDEYFLFYGKGPDQWKRAYDATLARSLWQHNKHFYSDSAYYFIRIDDATPLRINPTSSISDAASHTVTTFQDYQYHELDLYNLVASGREFYGDEFGINVNNNFAFNFPNIVTTSPGTVEARVAIRSVSIGSSFTFGTNGSTFITTEASHGDSPTSAKAVVRTGIFSFVPSSSNVNVSVTLNKGYADAAGWLDYLRINVTRQLQMTGSQMVFRDSTLAGSGQLASYQLSNANTVAQIWDITNISEPLLVPFVSNGNVAEWKGYKDVLHTYISFGNGGFFNPTAVGRVENQNLHALNDVDLIIITAPNHMEAATQLAELHSQEGMVVVLTTQQEIFNEFSSGNPDVTAIRMLIKMLYDRANGDPQLQPKNVLLFGDGDYSKNKGWDAFLGNNVIVFESDKSEAPLSSYVSDDYFVFLSDDDDASPDNFSDCGIGRIPADSRSSGLDYVSKVLAYVSEQTNGSSDASCIGDVQQSSFGPWRNKLIFVADDQDGSGGPGEYYHTTQSDDLANTMKTNYPEYDLIKIYMDAYQQESTPGGERYEAGEDEIRNRIEAGALVVTYLGHGGERGWAHERILNIETIANFTNKYRLPLFLTATCELAKFDDNSQTTAGEVLLMNPNGGAIAAMTTTRIVFVVANYQLDTAFFSCAMNDLDPELTFGKINMLTKNGVPASNDSKPNFSLLGDPALRLRYPKENVITTTVNGIDIINFNDTIKALEEVTITGMVTNANGEKLTNFNGFVYPNVFDKETRVTTLNNDTDPIEGGGQYIQFNTWNKIIFRGKASVQNGDFTFKYVVPYDINYTVGPGRISYYAVANGVDAHGYNENFKIGSLLESAQLNTVGPEISLFMNDTTFVSGGLTDASPILLALLSDDNGINTVGNGIGHDLTAIIDEETSNPLVLNDFYTSDTDTYKSGQVRYPLDELATGDHTLTLKAWDVHNNSSKATLEFTVAESSEIALDHVLNYPNPFTTRTYFMFEHNQACELLDVRIQIFSVSGKLVKSIVRQTAPSGFRSEPIEWDGLDDYGDKIGRGVYVYKVEITNPDGQKAEQYEKLVVLR